MKRPGAALPARVDLVTHGRGSEMMDDHPGGRGPTRRRLIRLAASGAALAPLALLSGREALAKTTKQVAQYQEQPKGDQTCSGCRFYEDGGACRLVEGEISPEAWCTLFQPAKG